MINLGLAMSGKMLHDPLLGLLFRPKANVLCLVLEAMFGRCLQQMELLIT